jgi:hypothetical protein
MQVLSLVHTGPVESLRDSLLKLYGFASEHGVISDEFRQEVYLDADNPEGNQIELHFVIHDWNGLLDRNLTRVLGEESRQEVMTGSEALSVGSSIPERFEWTKGMVQKLDTMADDDQRYEIFSRCAHVFPKSQIAKLGVVFEETRSQTGDPWRAVDAVIDFMIADPGWGVQPVRQGTTIYASKNPRNPEGYAQAQTDAERKRAYCFCPLIRDHLDSGMSDTFCYCSAGWERQQWEGAIGRPVRVDVVRSLLKGNNLCEFAIHLPEDL